MVYNIIQHYSKISGHQIFKEHAGSWLYYIYIFWKNLMISFEWDSNYEWTNCTKKVLEELRKHKNL